MIAKRCTLALLGAYKLFVSPLLPPACRFYPSCSVYTAEAVETHGVARGLWLGLRRLARCHPWSAGGFDPVPPMPSSAGSAAGRPEINVR